MDEEEDYQALFFTECQELLVELQDQLEQLEAGLGTPETVNAAFRAVHSVKGGAAAFEFQRLIGFAHAFETVMDRIRSDELALNEDVTNLLLRAADVMEQLVELAQSGSDQTPGTMERVLEELTILAADEGAPAPTPVTTDTAALPEAQGDPREVTVRVAPQPEFRTSGHDLLQLIRAAGPLGLVETKVEGEVAPLPVFDPDEWTLVWVLRFQTTSEPAEFDTLVEFYEMAAEIDIIDPHIMSEEAPTSEDRVLPVSEAPNEPQDANNPSQKPTAPATDPANPPATSPSATPSKSLRVDLVRIDRLVNLVGEMLITQSGLAQSFGDVDDANLSEVAQSVDVLSRQLRELQESVMAIRAQPVKSVFSRMPRVVRDLSDKLGKRARLVLSGEHTEVDTTVIEELSEPLMHMLRNSMDHGLEDHETRQAAGKDPIGTIELKAEHRGERVTISL
ncbi:MAG: Hpt domain-containing protein, partial [Pseudomonadota bacterium]